MAIYEVNGTPTIEKIEKYNESKDYFFRFQNKNWEMGEKSWGMIYSSEEEAREAYEEDGLDPDDAVLVGKSACYTAEELLNFAPYFDDDYVVTIIYGDSVGTGHDDEDVVYVCRIEEICGYNEFCNLLNK